MHHCLAIHIKCNAKQEAEIHCAEGVYQVGRAHEEDKEPRRVERERLSRIHNLQIWDRNEYPPQYLYCNGSIVIH